MHIHSDCFSFGSSTFLVRSQVLSSCLAHHGKVRVSICLGQNANIAAALNDEIIRKVISRGLIVSPPMLKTTTAAVAAANLTMKRIFLTWLIPRMMKGQMIPR